MKKNYVLDTNVLLYDPHAIFKFEDNNVIVPIYAIEEVDGTARLVGRSAEIYAVDPATVTAIHRTSRLIVRAAPEGPLDA